MNLINQNIIIISNEPWGDTWYSKHNYAYELSKNNKVFFINPTNKWSFKKDMFSVKIENYSDNLSIVNYNNILPLLNFLFFKANNFIVSLILKSFLKKNKTTNILFWSFDPHRLYSPRLLGCEKSIFHAVDKYTFTHWGEKLLYKNAEYFICVSSEIKKIFESYKKNILVLPHAISSEEFNSNAKPLDIPIEEYGLYVGNIDERLDYKQILEAVEKFPKIKFLFIGNRFYNENNILANQLFKEKKYSNVIYLGPKKFKELKNYIHYSKFCIAFMNDSVNGNRIAHHKIFQYLAFGKPVFSSFFSDYKPIEKYLYMEDGVQKTIDNISNYIENGEDISLKEKRIEIAKEHSFESAIKQIENLIHE